MTSDPEPAAAPPSDSPSPATPLSSRLFTGFLVVACIVLSVLVVILTRQNAELRAHASEAVERGDSRAIAVGDHLLPLECLGKSEADSQALQFEDGRFATVVFGISAECSACTASVPFFERIAAAHGSDSIRIVAAQAGATDTAALKSISGVTVVSVPEGQATWLGRIPLVPAVVVVDHQGAVRATWFGVLSARQQDDLDALLKLAANGWR